MKHNKMTLTNSEFTTLVSALLDYYLPDADYLAPYESGADYWREFNDACDCGTTVEEEYFDEYSMDDIVDRVCSNVHEIIDGLQESFPERFPDGRMFRLYYRLRARKGSGYSKTACNLVRKEIRNLIESGRHQELHEDIEQFLNDHSYRVHDEYLEEWGVDEDTELTFEDIKKHAAQKGMTIKEAYDQCYVY